MFDVFYLWIAVGITFLIVEMLTSTFYGLSLSIAGFLLAFYVSIIGAKDADILQWFAFAAISGFFCFVFPKFFNSYKKDTSFKTGLEAAIGTIAVLSSTEWGFKVKIDGVDYPVAESSVTDEFSPKKRVTIIGHDGVAVLVELVSKK